MGVRLREEGGQGDFAQQRWIRGFLKCEGDGLRVRKGKMDKTGGKRGFKWERLSRFRGQGRGAAQKGAHFPRTKETLETLTLTAVSRRSVQPEPFLAVATA